MRRSGLVISEIIQHRFNFIIRRYWIVFRLCVNTIQYVVVLVPFVVFGCYEVVYARITLDSVCITKMELSRRNITFEKNILPEFKNFDKTIERRHDLVRRGAHISPNQEIRYYRD